MEGVLEEEMLPEALLFGGVGADSGGENGLVCGGGGRGGGDLLGCELDEQGEVEGVEMLPEAVLSLVSEGPPGFGNVFGLGCDLELAEVADVMPELSGSFSLFVWGCLTLRCCLLGFVGAASGREDCLDLTSVVDVSDLSGPGTFSCALRVVELSLTEGACSSFASGCV